MGDEAKKPKQPMLRPYIMISLSEVVLSQLSEKGSPFSPGSRLLQTGGDARGGQWSGSIRQKKITRKAGDL
jgi:hypothetical protein